MEQISITLEPDVASAFLKAKPQIRQKAETLVNLWLKNLFTRKSKSHEELFELMDQISKIAQANGLTPEILDEILNEKS